MWALVFTLAWYDWGTGTEQFGSIIAGLHFTLILCAYDGLLTLVELNHAALMPDLTTCSADRTKLNNASAVGAILGSLSSFFGHMYWSADGKNMVPFQRFSAVVALLSVIGFTFSAEKVCSDVDRRRETKMEKSDDRDKAEKERKGMTILKVVREMSAHRNFGLFTVVSSLQVGHPPG